MWGAPHAGGWALLGGWRARARPARSPGVAGRGRGPAHRRRRRPPRIRRGPSSQPPRRRAGELLLIHLTDGAPADDDAGAQAGFVSPEAYATARRMESTRALDALGVRPCARLAYGLTDQETIFRLPELVERLAHDLAGCDAVVTHAYEGGHPDHDRAAAAVQMAAAAVRFEFAGGRRQGWRAQDGAVPPSTRLRAGADRGDLRRRSQGPRRRSHATMDQPLARLAFAPERIRLGAGLRPAQPPAQRGGALRPGGPQPHRPDWRAVVALYDAAAVPGAHGAETPSFTGRELRYELSFSPVRRPGPKAVSRDLPEEAASA